MAITSVIITFCAHNAVAPMTIDRFSPAELVSLLRVATRCRGIATCTIAAARLPSSCGSSPTTASPALEGQRSPRGQQLDIVRQGRLGHAAAQHSGSSRHRISRRLRRSRAAAAAASSAAPGCAASGQEKLLERSSRRSCSCCFCACCFYRWREAAGRRARDRPCLLINELLIWKHRECVAAAIQL